MVYAALSYGAFVVRGLPERELLAFAVCLDEHLAKDVEEHVNDDAVSSEFILCRVADSCGLNLVDVLVVHSHEPEALARCQLADAEFLALQLRGQFDCVLICHIKKSFYQLVACMVCVNCAVAIIFKPYVLWDFVVGGTDATAKVAADHVAIA